MDLGLSEIILQLSFLQLLGLLKYSSKPQKFLGVILSGGSVREALKPSYLNSQTAKCNSSNTSCALNGLVQRILSNIKYLADIGGKTLPQDIGMTTCFKLYIGDIFYLENASRKNLVKNSLYRYKEFWKQGETDQKEILKERKRGKINNESISFSP